jgi:hypothetical protein
MPSSTNTTLSDTQAQYLDAVAPEAVEVAEDRLLFPGGVLLPLTVRGGGIPGMPGRPWARLSASTFLNVNAPLLYSVAMRRELPDALRSSLRARRTIFEGLLMAAAEKTGRRPSVAEQATDQALEQTESQLAMGKPAYRVSLLAALFAERSRANSIESARRVLETQLKALNLSPQRLFYIAERALEHFQPGGRLFPGLDEPVLMLEEAVPILPVPSRQVFPASDAVWLGMHGRDGRDVYYSFTHGLDPTLPPPPHAITLILGEQGSGKTSLMRWIWLQRLLQGRTILTMDPEGENNHLCESLGGRVIPTGVPDDPRTCLIHPLQAITPAEMLLAVRFLIASIAGESVLLPGVQAALHEAVKRQWERQPGAMAISELVEALTALNNPDAAMPIALLRPYMQGGLLEGFFDRPKALLSTDFPPGQWWNFDLSGLREENRSLVYSVLAWFLYHAVTVGRQPMDIYIDEAWRLLRGGPFADLLDELGRRARKRGIGITLITHLPGDLARHPTSLSLASTAFIGRLGPDEAFTFFRALGVPEGEARRQAEQVSRLPPRVFLAAPSGGRGALFPLMVTIPPAWLEFWKGLGAAR